MLLINVINYNVNVITNLMFINFHFKAFSLYFEAIIFIFSKW